MKQLAAVLPCLMILQTARLRADVDVPRFFSDHAVLQRDKPLPVWGTADPGKAVEVSLGKKRARATADKEGRWLVTLDAQPASTVPLTLEISGRNRITRRDILLGDVWLCGGQSNMSIGVGHFHQVPEVKEDVKEADIPLIRQFGVKEHFATEAQSDVDGEWLVCDPRHAPRFTAVGFYFARKLHAQTGVPIGIVRSAKGSTTIKMGSPPGLRGDRSFRTSRSKVTRRGCDSKFPAAV